MSTNSMVYPPPTGTEGRVRVIDPVLGSTLLAIAKALLNDVLISSMEKVSGSPAFVLHSIVTSPLEVGFFGTLTERAETNGATKARRLSFANMFCGRKVKKRRK